MLTRCIRLFLVTTAMVLCLVPLQASAQISGTGQISGSVSDPSNAVVPHATVTVANAETGLERTVTTTDAGTYAVPLLTPGTYTVTVTAAGFKTHVNSKVVVQVATTSTVNVTLAVGTSSEVVDVQAQAASLQTQESSNGGTVIRLDCSSRTSSSRQTWQR